MRGSPTKLAPIDRVTPVVARRLLAVVMLVAITGCGDERIETVYGRSRGWPGEESVNGVRVLASMFKQAGHRVWTKRSLTDSMMEDCDVIVWAPDDFEPPSQEVIQWLDRWLSTDGRTLIFIGRDFDAAPGYYDKVIPGASPEVAGELRVRRTEAQSDYTARRSGLPANPDCNWFSLDTTLPLRKVTTLTGPWSDGIDASKVEIELRNRLQPKQYIPIDAYYYGDYYQEWDDVVAEVESISESSDEPEGAVYLTADDDAVLLSSGQDVLISRQAYDDSTDSGIILVANGSFLLNLPLVNQEHRKIAGKLVAEVGQSKKVVVLESLPGGPPIRAEDPAHDIPTGFAMFAKRPLDVVLFHLAILGVVFCLSRLPIFGRPRKPAHTGTSDFGKHVSAFGELLELTGDRGFATSRVNHYKQAIAGDAAPPAPDVAEGK